MTIGRPTDYTQELADEICIRIVRGQSLRQISSDDDMPCKETIFEWRFRHAYFARQYALAREYYSEAVFDDTIEIADEQSADWYDDPETGERKVDHEAIQRSRLRIEARQWALARMDRKRFGNHTQQEISNPDGSLLTVDERAKRVEALVKLANERKITVIENDDYDLA